MSDLTTFLDSISDDDFEKSKLTRKEIDARIEYIQEKHARATHPADLKALARTLERLIMLDAVDDPV